MNKVCSVNEMKRKAARKIKRIAERNKFRKIRKTKADTHAAISNNVGCYFNAKLKTALDPVNRFGHTEYLLAAGIRGVILKRPPVVTYEIAETRRETWGMQKEAVIEKRMKVKQRYFFYITHGFPVKTVKDLEKFRHVVVKLGEICVNFQKDKITFE